MNINGYEFSDFVDVEGLPILTRTIGNVNYDYEFRTVFKCKSLHLAPEKPVLLRIGAIDSYEDLQGKLLDAGIHLLCTVEQYKRASILEHWYPLISEYTPFSMIYEHFPTTSEIKKHFEYPVFIKGNRQTSKHSKELSIIENDAMLENLRKKWSFDNILFWQKIVVRDFIELQKVDDLSYPDSIQFSYEFRAFYWKKNFVGIAKYWYLGNDYALSIEDKEKVLALGGIIADIINVPFISIDFAKTKSGGWIVIEINDGQESGYAGNLPLAIWKNIIFYENAVDNK